MGFWVNYFPNTSEKSVFYFFYSLLLFGNSSARVAIYRPLPVGLPVDLPLGLQGGVPDNSRASGFTGQVACRLTVWFTSRLSLRCAGLSAARLTGCFAHRFACRLAKRLFVAICRSQWQGGNRSATILYSESGLHDLSRAIAVRRFRAQLAMSASNCVGEHSLAPAMIDTMVVKMLVACFFHFGIHAPWQQVTQPSSFGTTRDRMNCGVATARSTAQECSLILPRYKKDII